MERALRLEKRRAYRLAYKTAHPLRFRIARLKYVFKQHGITAAIWMAAWSQQEGKCASCGGRMRVPQIDHDHDCCPMLPACGKCFRGLLCFRCNAALGLLGDNPEKIRALLEYRNAWRLAR